MSDRAIRDALEVIRRQTSASTEEIGAIHACLLDVPEGMKRLLEEILPRVVESQADLDRLLDHLVDFKLDLEHMARHLADASAVAQALANRIEKRLPAASPHRVDREKE